MDKIERPPLNGIPSLEKLAQHWKQWGEDYELFISCKKKNEQGGQDFSWRSGIYENLLMELKRLTFEYNPNNEENPWEHCSFCDGHPIGTESKETIEHYYPKSGYPLKAYEWENLFYCCDKCQQEANADRNFEPSLKPDENYEFAHYFRYNPYYGTIEILPDISEEAKIKAKKFLKRYGINILKRTNKRKLLCDDLFKFLESGVELRSRDTYPYRYIYDHIKAAFAALP